MPVRFFSRWISLPALISTLVLNSPAIAVAQSTAYQTVIVTDDSGAQTRFAAPPQRIVSLNTGHTETVFALGAGDRLVAVDSYSNYPSAAQQVQPRLNTYPTVSVETIVSLKPDLVLALVEKDDVLSELRQQGVPILKFFPKDFETTTQEIATLFDEMDASDQTKPFAAGPNGFYGQLVDLAGAANIYADVPGDFAQVRADSVVARCPDLIVLADPHSPN